MGLLTRLREWLFGARAGSAADDAPDTGDDTDNKHDDDRGGAPAAVRVRIGDALDLHYFAPRDMVRAAEDYLDEARQRGLYEVRLIHGRGKGVQRANIRRMLARRRDVEAFGDAPAHLGGWGATVVRLKRGGGA